MSNTEAVRTHMRQLLRDAVPDLWFGPGDDRFHFFYGLLECHPSADVKIGCGVAAFSIRVNPPYNNRGPWLRRIDGTATDWSYTKCLATPSAWTKFSRGLRKAIEAQTIRFHELHSTGPGQHVDHEEPTFDALARDFVAAYKIDWTEAEYEPSRDGLIGSTVLKETPWLTIWREAHAACAKLRILDADENLRRPKKVG